MKTSAEKYLDERFNFHRKNYKMKPLVEIEDLLQRRNIEVHGEWNDVDKIGDDEYSDAGAVPNSPLMKRFFRQMISYKRMGHKNYATDALVILSQLKTEIAQKFGENLPEISLTPEQLLDYFAEFLALSYTYKKLLSKESPKKSPTSPKNYVRLSTKLNNHELSSRISKLLNDLKLSPGGLHFIDKKTKFSAFKMIFIAGAIKERIVWLGGSTDSRVSTGLQSLYYLWIKLEEHPSVIKSKFDKWVTVRRCFVDRNGVEIDHQKIRTMKKPSQNICDEIDAILANFRVD